eukprot:6209380-Pleurochrysis_carterae.AAC.2
MCRFITISFHVLRNNDVPVHLISHAHEFRTACELRDTTARLAGMAAPASVALRRLNGRLRGQVAATIAVRDRDHISG